MSTRSLRIAAGFAVAFALAACSPSATPTPKPTPTPTPTPTPEPTPTPRVYTYADLDVGFVQTGSESAWRVANTGSFVDTAAKLGIKLNVYDSAGRYDNQIEALGRFIADPKVNVIVLAPVTSAGYDVALKQAKAAGKIVILETGRIDADPSLYTTYVSSDFVEEGKKAGAAMCDLLKNSEKKRVAEITGPAGDPIAADRSAGFHAAIKTCGIDIPANLVGASDWGVGTSTTVMSAFLRRTKDIQGLFAASDEEAVGAIAAIKAAKLRAGKNIQLVSIDATADGFKYLISGELGADVEYSPLLAPQVFDAAVKVMNGDTSVPKWIPTQEVIYTAAQGAAALQLAPSRKY
jgi:galactofuranose transport system substrate-binding protein